MSAPHHQLFGGTVFKLGTEKHHGKFLDQIDNVNEIGCFGLTEVSQRPQSKHTKGTDALRTTDATLLCGCVCSCDSSSATVRQTLSFAFRVKAGEGRCSAHRCVLLCCLSGNNAVEMETTATYDPQTQQWDIFSPSIQSQKYWITNSAVDARWCVVFAQTIVAGVNEGIHGFLVPIRNADHSVAKNVRLEDVRQNLDLAASCSQREQPNSRSGMGRLHGANECSITSSAAMEPNHHA